MINWEDTTRVDRFSFELVDPFNLDMSRGVLDGVVTDDCSITLGYYTDTRISASIRVVGGGYVPNSLVRIHHYVDAWGYHNELGTFFVVGTRASSSSDGADATEFDLASMLSRVSDDKLESHFSIAARANSNDVLAELFRRYNVDFRIDPSAVNKRYDSVKLYKRGESVLSVVFDICDNAGNRLDVDGHGIAVVSRYLAAGEREPSFAYRADVRNSLIVGEIEESSDFYSTPNRAVVEFVDGDYEVGGVADVAASAATAYGKRGRRVTEFATLDDLEPRSVGQAAARARERLDGLDDVQVELALRSLYVPLNSGEVALILQGGRERACMLKNRDVSLAPGMECSDTWKVVRDG